MNFNHMVEKAWSQNILFSVLIELTYRCNLDCFFCYNDVNLKGTPLSKEQYLQLFEDLCDMQVLNLTLSGGEPLAHPDFWLLGRKARELGFLTRVKSNGHALGGRLARRMKEEVDPFLIELSLHGAQAQTHDRQTRVPGSFERLMKNIPEMLELGLRVKINSTLTAWNEDEMEGMYELADRFGVSLSIDPTVTPMDDGNTEPLQISASQEAIARMFRLQLQRKLMVPPKPEVVSIVKSSDEMPNTAKKNCGAGSSTVTIDPYGNVYPCVQWRRPLGNLHQQTIPDIWNGSPELDNIRRQTVEARQMVDSQGNLGAYMGFCPGLAELTTGSPVQIYPAARRKMQGVAQACSKSETILNTSPSVESE